MHGGAGGFLTLHVDFKKAQCFPVDLRNAHFTLLNLKNVLGHHPS